MPTSLSGTWSAAILDHERTFVPVTVLLETDWVLRSAYGFPRSRSVEAIRALAGLPGVTLENPGLVADAVENAHRGMHFADALHLAASAGCSALLTFDRRFIRKVQVAAPPVSSPVSGSCPRRRSTKTREARRNPDPGDDPGSGPAG